MENLNIRIYKVVPDNGTHYFEWKEKDFRRCETHTLMRNLAISVKLRMNGMTPEIRTRYSI